MCGIVGYIGYKEAGTVLLNGLKRLEYHIVLSDLNCVQYPQHP